MSGQEVDTNAFYDTEVTSVGVLITELLVVEKRDGEQFDVLQAIIDAYSTTIVETAVLSDHIVDEIPVDVSGYWPLYTVEANAEAVSNVGTATTHTLGADTFYMPDLTNASSGPGVDYFLGDHVDSTLTVPTVVVNGSTDSNVDVKVSAGGVTIFSEDGSGWFSEFNDEVNFDASGVVDSSGGLRGVLSASTKLYISYPDASGTQYFDVTSALVALLGLSPTTPYVSTGTERSSLHRFSYSIDFDVSIPIAIEPEHYMPDFELTNQAVNAMEFHHSNVGIVVTDDLSGNRVQSTNGESIYFVAPTLQPMTIEAVSPRAKEYADTWLDLSGHSFHTLIKGLFGQMLLDTGTIPVEVTLDDAATSGEAFAGFVTDDSLQRNVEPKKVGWVESSGDVNDQSFFQDEHDALILSLRDAFRDVWSGAAKDENIDWYAALYKKSQTGDLFTNGDTFSVPIELTMRFTIASNTEPNQTPLNEYTDPGGADAGQLTPLAITITNIVTTSDQEFESKWRFIYNFAVV
jgi:hypothetical protein